MKVLKRIMILIIILAILGIGIIAGIAINDGYNMYKVAIEEISLEDKINNIKSIENYTKLEELPKIYKDAVLAVEDHRFYKHNGIDIIAIGRAVVYTSYEFCRRWKHYNTTSCQKYIFYPRKKDYKKNSRSIYGKRNRKKLLKR